MNNKVMIDSSLLIEYIKNAKTILLDSLLKNDSLTCYINETVVSEFFFHHLKVSTNKAPATLKEAEKVAEVLTSRKDYLIIHFLIFCQLTIAYLNLFHRS